MSAPHELDAARAEVFALDPRLEAIAPECLIAYRARTTSAPRTGCSRCDRDRAEAQARAAGEVLVHCLASLPGPQLVKLKDALGGPERITFRYRTGPGAGIVITR